MNKLDDDFKKSLLSLFKVEAQEHVQAITSGLIELEKKPAYDEERIVIIEAIFRAAHSLKGSADAVSLTDIASICQSFENVFSALKKNEISIQAEDYDKLIDVVDTIGQLLSHTEGTQTPVDKDLISKQIRQLDILSAGKKESEIQPEDGFFPKDQDDQTHTPEDLGSKGEELDIIDETAENAESAQPGFPAAQRSSVPIAADMVRVSASKLNSMFLHTEELIPLKLSTQALVYELSSILTSVGLLKTELAKIRPVIQTLRKFLAMGDNELLRKDISQVIPLLEFLDWNHIQIISLESKLAILTKTAEHDHRHVAGLVDNVVEDVKKVLMLPFSTLVQIFPKLVRDLSRDLRKDTELVIKGGEIEIDKRILDEMKDPFIHLVRNCVDHGIERPEAREQNNKPRRGTITIALSRVNSGKVEVLISDDGSGIDIERVKEAAVKAGIISGKDAEMLNDQEALTLVFQSSLSTSPVITEISGRGLGLAIVQERVEKLGGRISLESVINAGTTIKVVLPLTLANFRGMVVRAGDQLFVVPITNIEQVLRVKRDGITTVENKETLRLNGQSLSLVGLDDILGISQHNLNGEDSAFIPVMVLSSGESTIAFRLDEVLYEQEVVVKSLGKQLTRVPNIAGATVLGSGKVLPVLNVFDLIKSAVKFTPVLDRVRAAEKESIPRKKRVLVVEDAITSRTLLKSILETAGGYDVETAVDGIEAIAFLQTEDFDLVVSDIEIPRMNGFELTTEIRRNEKLEDLPVVLITGLESGEDRERGIDAGANAYIAKSSFDQSNLLEIIKSLI